MTTIKQDVQILIHSASSINLRAPLAKLIAPIIDASLAVANLARSCEKFEHFVYISTAYSNSHLHDQSKGLNTDISEDLHLLQNGALAVEDAEEEYQKITKRGDLEISYKENFPWAYGYAKHLTERLLTNMFMDKTDSLLIIRPSIIGPAEIHPYPGYEVLGSAPLTMIAAAMLLEPSTEITFASPFADPMAQSYLDEVPVDVVVNRIIVHLAARNSGIVHAVSGKAMRFNLGTMWREVMAERLLPWNLTIKWKNVSWHSRELHSIARTFVIAGTSYAFLENRTVGLCGRLSVEDVSKFPLFSTRSTLGLSARRHALKENLEFILQKKGWPAGLSALATKALSWRDSRRCEKLRAKTERKVKKTQVVDEKHVNDSTTVLSRFDSTEDTKAARILVTEI